MNSGKVLVKFSEALEQLQMMFVPHCLEIV